MGIEVLHIVVIGGGAAGFFAALSAKATNPTAKVTLLERSAKFLSKVRISGGGRCNVTHNSFEPRDLVQNYPRGSRELLGPLHRFQPRDTVDWFESRGVELKAEGDGRMFPVSNSSSSIINCLMEEAAELGVDLLPLQRIVGLSKKDNRFCLDMKDGDRVEADKVLIATGSSKHGHEFAGNFGHSIEALVPSLFTFNIPSFDLVALSGVSLKRAKLSLEGTKLSQTAPLLITHWGFSGPAALKLSSWGARYLFDQDYSVQLRIDWLPDSSREAILDALSLQQRQSPNQALGTRNPFDLPKKLWKALLDRFGLDELKPLCNIGKKDRNHLLEGLKNDVYSVKGKTTNKEEFVTCGGVKRSEIDFKTMESKLCSGLYFAGEVIDIDGVTGGFNFQNAWTTGWIAGQSMGSVKTG